MRSAYDMLPHGLRRAPDFLTVRAASGDGDSDCSALAPPGCDPDAAAAADPVTDPGPDPGPAGGEVCCSSIGVEPDSSSQTRGRVVAWAGRGLLCWN